MSNQKTDTLSSHIYRWLHTALGIMRDNGGFMRASELRDAVEEKEGHTFPQKQTTRDAKGRLRWVVNFDAWSIEFVHAGLIKKDRGVWNLTAIGRDAAAKPADDVILQVQEAEKEWRKLRDSQKKSPTSSQPTAIDVSEESESDSASEAIQIEKLEEQARDGIVGFINRMRPDAVEQLVAALLRGMGYYITHFATGGPDGGLDVIANHGPLGATGARLKVQVKHYAGSQQKISVQELDRLSGLVLAGEIGVFVSTSGFTREVYESFHKPRAQVRHIELIDVNRLIDLWREHYHALSDEDKARLPLHSITFLKPSDND